ncbi:D-2-hydroxyacid dehydrogenase [Phenylobacterium sp.]|uniref:D-2-hydroxyacid dehydrogenase n=1 Tax=Phenylobacterium sp. TaxID=1871053 RepID=UPI0035AF1CF3
MARPLNIVFLDSDTIRPEVKLRAPNLPHAFCAYSSTAPDEVAERIAEADVVITNKVPLTAGTIAAAPRLKLVAVAATGYDVVDVAACRARGVVVSNVRDYASASITEHVFALIFALRRNLIGYRDAVAAGRWLEAEQFCFFDYPIETLSGATLGVIGAGALGTAVGETGRALGMKVAYAGRKGEPPAPGRTDFAELLATSDVISLHCPLTPQTRGLIGEVELRAMARRPILINTARGGVVDETVLGRALEEGWISGAGFDVATAEPPPEDHPLMRLIGRHDFILTPHVAWASRESVQALVDQVIDNIEAFVAGAPRNRVA